MLVTLVTASCASAARSPRRVLVAQHHKNIGLRVTCQLVVTLEG